MMKNNFKNNLRKNTQKGFLELIVIILVAIILLRFLNIDIDSILAKELFREFMAYTKDMLIMVWQDMISIIDAIRKS